MTEHELSWEPPDPGEWDFDSAHQHSVATATAQEIIPGAFKAGFELAFARFGLPLSHMATEFVIPEDVQELFAAALRHRVVLDPAAEVEGLAPDEALERTLRSVAVPR